jgi:hypothetical protein
MSDQKHSLEERLKANPHLKQLIEKWGNRRGRS